MSESITDPADLGDEILPAAVPAWAEQIADELAARWLAGERPLVEEYLARYPALLEHREAALELIAEEIRLRQEAGQPLDEGEYGRRFPRWRGQVRTLVRCLGLLSPVLGRPCFPAAGELLGGFRLLKEIGRGAHARVYLASQTSLADRPVVLKLCPLLGCEHLSLSRLQHTNIVPLHSAHDFPERDLRALCQPCFGGAALSELLRDLGDIPAGRRCGRDLVRVLRVRHGRFGAPAVSRELAFIERSSWVEAVCWVGACLADALQHAHERGLLHLDIKPSNVLLAGDGQPMLLDFHLAHPPLPAGAPGPFAVGGTPGYMPPEQEAALAAVRAGEAIPAAIDARADVYALGVLLYESLGDEAPPPAPQVALRRRNGAVSPGLADLLGRCLEADPARRYAMAADVAADLRRHLAGLPLRGVANRSARERWRKWRRRRPRLLPLLGFLVAGALAVGLLGLHLAREVRRAEAAARKGEGHLREGRHAEALETFRSGAVLVADLPLTSALRERLRQGGRRAKHAALAAELHALCERMQPAHAADDLAGDQAARLEEGCRALWEKRREMLDISGEGAGQARVKTDLLDLAVLYADLSVRAARGERQTALAHERALGLLGEAEGLLGPSAALRQEIAVHAKALGRPADPRSGPVPPCSAWEHYALGRAALRAGDARAAAAHLDRALALEPGALWPAFARGLAAFRLGEHQDALASFSACVALAPRSAPCVYNRGRAFLELGRVERARQDFAQAATLDPAFAAAAMALGDAERRPAP